MSQRSIYSAFAMVFLALCDPGEAVAGENRLGVPIDSPVIRVPVVKREAVVRKQLKSRSDELKRRLLAPAALLRGGQPAPAKKKKLWPPAAHS